MRVGEACSRCVVVVGPATPVGEAAKLMREHHVGSLVVVSDGAAAQPLGIVTDRDLVVEVLSADIDYRTVSVGEIIAEELGDIVQAIGREQSSEAARRH